MTPDIQRPDDTQRPDDIQRPYETRSPGTLAEEPPRNAVPHQAPTPWGAWSPPSNGSAAKYGRHTPPRTAGPWSNWPRAS